MMHDTEDKKFWCVHGSVYEKKFCDEIAPMIGLSAEINPQKEYCEDGKYKPDIFVDGVMSDLKHVTTPFFTAGKYGMNPSTTVTLNVKDISRYRELYPYLVIYFWVAWEVQENYGIKVDEVNGVWRMSVKKFDSLQSVGRVPVHCYRRRENDESGNAKDSYLIDLRTIQCLARFDGG